MKTQKEIKLKNGTTLPKGLPARFEEPSTICIVTGPDREYRVRASSAFHPPRIARLEKDSNDGVCESVFGDRVEPDGWDSEGSPSWLLALGLI